jgi:hypothetical protein
MKWSEIAKKYGMHPLTSKEVAEVAHHKNPHVKYIDVWDSLEGKFEHFGF